MVDDLRRLGEVYDVDDVEATAAVLGAHADEMDEIYSRLLYEQEKHSKLTKAIEWMVSGDWGPEEVAEALEALLEETTEDP
jgi:glutamine synthetase adenylyltransferase